MSNLIRVVYAEDHALVRKGISSLLRSLPDVELVAEAANGRDALDEKLALIVDHILGHGRRGEQCGGGGEAQSDSVAFHAVLRLATLLSANIYCAAGAGAAAAPAGAGVSC